MKDFFRNLLLSAICYLFGCVALSGLFLIATTRFCMPVKQSCAIYIIACLISYLGYFYFGKKYALQLNNIFLTIVSVSIIPLILAVMLFCVPGISYIPLYIGYMYLKTFDVFWGYLIYFFPIVSILIGVLVKFHRAHETAEKGKRTVV